MSQGALIVAMTQNHVIGQGGTLPWHLPDELQWFKQQTLGKIIIMGSRTFASLGHRPLPGRENWVLSRQPQNAVRHFDSWSAVITALPEDAPWVVIGGASVYALALPIVQTLYITWVEGDVPEGDCFFPALDFSDWRCEDRQDHSKDDRHDRAFSCCTYRRVQGGADANLT